MSNRTSITLSDDLYKRLQLVKHSLNISGICQVAIESAVRIEEIKLERKPAMTETIERLKLEKREVSKMWVEQGFLDGGNDTAELSYQEFQEIASTQKLNENLLEWIEHRHLQYLENPDKTAYLEGWKNAILSFWNEIKEQLE